MAYAPNTPPVGTMKRGDFFEKQTKWSSCIFIGCRETAPCKQTAVAGLSVGAFIRKLIIGKEIRPRPPDEYVKLLREINAVGNNINQIAHIANAERHISADKIEEVLKMQDEIMRLVRSVR